MGGIAGVYLLRDPSRFTPVSATFSLISLTPLDESNFVATFRIRQTGHTIVEAMGGVSHIVGNSNGWPRTSTQEEPWELHPEGYQGKSPPPREEIQRRVKVEIGKDYVIEPGQRLILYDYTPAGGRPRHHFLIVTRR
jgi:hypothetical protein